MRKLHRQSPGLNLVALGLVIFVFFSCGIGTTNIGDIKGHPRDYAGKEVTISGEVTDTFSIFIVKYFVLRDATGEMTVVTEKPLPAKGEKIAVKGMVKEAFSLGSKTELVLEERTEKTGR